ncbi:MAG TPA: PSD1 and planctomycete cytochrome C domain-containing protein, partial [Gemmataceae bacterium]|nr:PSD1 and planctomycete cytochrome C domain-containing protein [Gemmataceae bacterium]
MRAIGACLLLLTVAAAAMAESAPDRETFFELKIRPVLAGTCLHCHDARKSRSGLRVDSRAALLRGGKRGPAIVPGQPEQSLLLHALKHDSQADVAMPPGKTLPANTVADFSHWIQAGAVWPANHPLRRGSPPATQHWAFQPVHKYVPPADPSGWSVNPIDCFIAAGHRLHELHPASKADRRTLLRRVYFDLIGLPPTPAEICAFLNDPAPDAYARVVDRLLASPQYGERWGRHWMDLVRYADTAGDNADYPVPEAYLYRDYIIAAFNSDKPYNQFLTEQLAGDILARHGPRERYAEQVIATTYLGLSRRYLTAPYEQWHLTIEDTIDTTGRAFLGLTLRCARCHDHKFDPVTQRDYYALYGIFVSTQFPYGGSEEFASMNRPRQHLVPLLPPAEAKPRLEAHRKELAGLGKTIDQLEKTDPLARRLQAISKIITIETRLLHDLQQQHQPADDVSAALAGHTKQAKIWRSQLDGKIEPLRAERRRLERSNLPPDVPGAYAVMDGKATDVPLQRAGDPDRPGPIVPRGTPAFLTRKPIHIPAGSSGRLELARWLTDPANPLTARVLVNRLWQYHFGKGLVATPSDFGTRGTPPTHPELLDWLAARFVASGWSIKAMHRLILLSHTYQLAS